MYLFITILLRIAGRAVPPSSPPKRQNKLKSLIFRKKSRDSANKLSQKLSAIGIVEELFEEGSAMLAERFPDVPARSECLVSYGLPFYAGGSCRLISRRSAFFMSSRY
ncbi:hypothetical protein EJ110_NYTH30941 [Nymphaea thermarum]|nr:hypothetical protein EJ110_NYTH30941 [Nymphaea thermarum]